MTFPNLTTRRVGLRARRRAPYSGQTSVTLALFGLSMTRPFMSPTLKGSDLHTPFLRGSPLTPCRRLRAAAGNGIFVVGDRRPTTCLRDEMRRDARAALTIAKNRPKIGLSAGRSSTASFGGSNLGPID
jgi:hypothetical protein